MSAAARILDANFNRAREALRVMEDAARFALNDDSLCEELKSLRHALRDAADQLQPAAGWLEANRDVSGDVGTQITMDSEMSRTNLLDVVIAAGKRLTESLRVIEEMSKIDAQTSKVESQQAEVRNERSAVGGRKPRSAAASVESIRYRAYEIDAKLQLRFGSGKARQWRLCLVLTQSLCKLSWDDVLRRAIAGGADCVQVREKTMTTRALTERVKAVREIAGPGVSVIVNDRVDVALAAGADGVHLGQDDLSVREVRKIAGRELIIGASVHDMAEALRAAEDGADYCGVGTMFQSALKPERTPCGPAFLQAFIERYPNLPHLAIGGITAANIPQIAAAGGKGVAVSSAICGADDPQCVSKMIRHVMNETTNEHE